MKLWVLICLLCFTELCQSKLKTEIDSTFSAKWNKVLHTDLEEDEDIYLFTSDHLPDDIRHRPSVANGHIGTVVKSNTVHMNGVYNGHLSNSHRAIIPSALNVNITDILINGVTVELQRSYSLNASTGTYRETLVYKDVTVEYCLYAHRTVPSLLVLAIHASQTSKSNVSIHLNISSMDLSEDITFKDGGQVFSSAHYRFGVINEPETQSSGRTEVHVVHDVLPVTLTLASGQGQKVMTFLMAADVTKDRAFAGYQKGQDMLSSGQLYTEHVSAWAKLWSSGTVEMTGNTAIGQMTIGSLYYILSSLPTTQDPTWPYIGLSPNGLPWGDRKVAYSGSVFWDQDTWMYPPVLALHQNLGHILIETRKRTRLSAALNAIQYGYKGLKYPWESRFTGLEATQWGPAANGELHINGDVVFAILQYFWASGDKSMFMDDVYGDIITGVADFWISRLQYNWTSDKYVTLDAFGPDEYHTNVNNSVYINSMAKMTLETAAWLTGETGKAANLGKNIYQYYADRIFINYDEKLRYHPQYDGYEIGTKIKQADVVMLGFPFMFNLTLEQRRNDLNIYEKVTDMNGPAMTWCMHTVNWLELGDEQKAYDNLKKTFSNVASPFQVWSEFIGGSGAPSFITGQGGFLQAILFGYGGIRIRPDRLDLDITLPPNVTQIRFKGLDYLNCSMNILADKEEINIVTTAISGSVCNLNIHQGQQTYSLSIQHTITLPRTRSFIQRQ